MHASVKSVLKKMWCQWLENRIHSSFLDRVARLTERKLSDVVCLDLTEECDKASYDVLVNKMDKYSQVTM